MNGLRLKITWNVDETNRLITASVLLPDKEYRGLRFYHGSYHSSVLYDGVMNDLIHKLSAEGWATRIVDDNTIEVIRIALPADIKYEQRCKA